MKKVFDSIDDRKGINIPQYLKKRNNWEIFYNDVASIANQNEQPLVILKLNNIYSFISELDKMFTSNSVFTEEVSELKLYNRPISIYINNDQANVEAYMEKVNEINELKTKILKKMKFCVADSIFEKINKP